MDGLGSNFAALDSTAQAEYTTGGLGVEREVGYGDATPPRPFVKWVGGKRQLLPELLAHRPKQFGAYHEPFVGGGALFFALRPNKAVLSDSNPRLVRTWRGIRDQVEEVIDRLAAFRQVHSTEFFYEFRGFKIDDRSDAEVAAWFIYLNKTAYNGLYRVNRKNEFNVPVGRYKNPCICDADNLRACSKALSGVEILVEDFSAVVNRAREGDFVYFDPPYVPLSATSLFVGYTAEKFGMEQQLKLRDVARTLKRKGVSVMLSNSAAGLVRELYHGGFEIREVMASRAVNCQAKGRGKIQELIIC